MRFRKAMRLALVVLLAAPGIVRAADTRFILRAGESWLRSDDDWSGDLLLTEGQGIDRLETDGNTTSPQIGFEVLFNHRFGLNTSILRTTYEIHGEGLNFDGRFGEVTGWPILLDANFHAGGKFIDLYAGPVVGWVVWRDLQPSADLQVIVPIDDVKMHGEFAWGLNAGMDLLFGRHWGLTIDLKGLRYDARTADPAFKAVLGGDLRIPINPLVGTAGLSVRW